MHLDLSNACGVLAEGSVPIDTNTKHLSSSSQHTQPSEVSEVQTNLAVQVCDVQMAIRDIGTAQVAVCDF